MGPDGGGAGAVAIPAGLGVEAPGLSIEGDSSAVAAEVGTGGKTAARVWTLLLVLEAMGAGSGALGPSPSLSVKTLMTRGMGEGGAAGKLALRTGSV